MSSVEVKEIKKMPDFDECQIYAAGLYKEQQCRYWIIKVPSEKRKKRRLWNYNWMQSQKLFISLWVLSLKPKSDFHKHSFTLNIDRTSQLYSSNYGSNYGVIWAGPVTRPTSTHADLICVRKAFEVLVLKQKTNKVYLNPSNADTGLKQLLDGTWEEECDGESHGGVQGNRNKHATGHDLIPQEDVEGERDEDDDLAGTEKGRHVEPP